jgi:hypothetical protein
LQGRIGGRPTVASEVCKGGTQEFGEGEDVEIVCISEVDKREVAMVGQNFKGIGIPSL